MSTLKIEPFVQLVGERFWNEFPISTSLILNEASGRMGLSGPIFDALKTIGDVARGVVSSTLAIQRRLILFGWSPMTRSWFVAIQHRVVYAPLSRSNFFELTPNTSDGSPPTYLARRICGNAIAGDSGMPILAAVLSGDGRTWKAQLFGYYIGHWGGMVGDCPLPIEYRVVLAEDAVRIMKDEAGLDLVTDTASLSAGF